LRKLYAEGRLLIRKSWNGVVYLRRGFHKTRWADRKLIVFQNNRVQWCQLGIWDKKWTYVCITAVSARLKNSLPRTRTTLHRFGIFKHDMTAVSKPVRWNFIHYNRIRGIARPPSYKIPNTYTFSWTGGDGKNGINFLIGQLPKAEVGVFSAWEHLLRPSLRSCYKVS
jgi:hypothetical protein